jgi:hypothetical protein
MKDTLLTAYLSLPLMVSRELASLIVLVVFTRP